MNTSKPKASAKTMIRNMVVKNISLKLISTNMQKAIRMNSSIFKTFFLSLAIIANTHFAYCQTASILPPAKTTFVDQNGKPLTSGTVDFYVPNTTTRKTTWQDSAESIPNTNPVVLDAAGRATILGDGAYRQVVKDRYGNLVWDSVTSSIGSGGTGTTVGDGMPVGFVAPTSAIIAPANYQFAYGQALSRTTYPELLAAITFNTSIGCTGGSPIITISDTSSLSLGTVLESICVAGSPTIISKTSSTVTLSSNATITTSTTGRFFPYGNGNGSTTFNVVDMRGYVPAGRCNMGGVDCANLNSTYFSNISNNTPSSLNAKGGSQSTTLTAGNLPPHTHTSPTLTDPGHHHTEQASNNPQAGATGGGGLSLNIASNATITGDSFTGITLSANTGTNGTGTSTPFSGLQPTITLNYIIKVTPDVNLSPTFGVAAIGGMTGVITCGSGITCAGNTISATGVVSSIQGMTGDITCGAGMTCAGNTIISNNASVLQSRSAATFLNIGNNFDGIQTLGYYKGGDGGGARFYRNNGAILTYTVTNAGSCTNNTWSGIKFNGGSGKGAYGTVIVSGGVASSITIQGAGAQGNYYTVGDVLTASSVNMSCTVYPQITVNSVGNGPFIDSFVTGYSVSNAGSGCTNGSYPSLVLQNTKSGGGGFGDKFAINVDVVGGVITGTSSANPGGGYRVGDQLSFVLPNGTGQIPGCATQPVITITSVSTPLGSFTDSGGTAWQILPNADNVNVLQFGAKSDYNSLTTDNDATDNGPAFRAALTFALIGNNPPDARGYGGGTVFVPKGDYLVCGGVIVYDYTTFKGVSWGGTVLHQCNSDGVSASLITQGSPTSNVAVFASNIWDMTLYGSNNGTGSLIYSNNNQSGDAVSRVAIYANATNRTCLKYEIGYGGQSMYGVHNVLCVPIQGSPAFDFSGNFGVQIDGQTMIASILTVDKGFRFGDGGTVLVSNGVHCEGAVTNCIYVDGSGSSPPVVTLQGVIGPATTNLVYITTGTPANYVSLIGVHSNGSPCTVFKQATASCVKTGIQTGIASYP